MASYVQALQAVANVNYVDGALLGVACSNFITAFDVKCKAWTRVPLFLGAICQIVLSVSLLYTSYDIVASWYYPEFFSVWKKTVIFNISMIFIDYVCRIVLYMQRIAIVLVRQNRKFGILQVAWVSMGLLQLISVVMELYYTLLSTDYAVTYTALVIDNLDLQSVSLAAIIYGVILTLITDGWIVYMFYSAAHGLGQSFFRNYSKSRLVKLLVYVGFMLAYITAVSTNSIMPDSNGTILNFFDFVSYAILQDFFLVDVAQFGSGKRSSNIGSVSTSGQKSGGVSQFGSSKHTSNIQGVLATAHIGQDTV
jgi:hypothetical protein